MALYETPVGREWLTFEFGLGAEPFDRLRDFNGRACLVMPSRAAGGAVYAVITAEDPNTLPSLEAAFPKGRVMAEHFIGGTPYAAIFEVPAGTSITGEALAAPAEFGGLIALRDYRVADQHLNPGDTLQMTLTWELTEATPAALTSFIHVIGPPRPDGSLVYAQRDSQPCDNAYPTWQWRPGEVLLDYLTLPLPEALPAGSYAINVGWYDAGTQQRLPLTGPAASSGSYTVSTLEIAAP
jgi:hypothetical protein